MEPSAILERWADWMRLSGLAPRTITARVGVMRRIETAHGPALTLTHADLLTHLAQYSHAKTRQTVRGHIRAFYGWAIDEQHLEIDPSLRLPRVKVPANRPRPVSTDDLARAMREAPDPDRLWLELMAYAGLRGSEVAGIRRGDARQESDGTWVLSITQGKGGAEQAVKIAAWLAERILAVPEWVISSQTVRRRTRRAFDRVGSRSRGHALRHWYGTAVLRTTGNLRITQEAMRHASPTSTAMYTAIASTELSAAAESLPRIA
jgi:integrase/recombinase XerD